jgi:hypothetical protein
VNAIWSSDLNLVFACRTANNYFSHTHRIILHNIVRDSQIYLSLISLMD